LKANDISFRLDGPVTCAGLVRLLAPLGAAEPAPEEVRKLVWFDSFDWRLAGGGLCLALRDDVETVLYDMRSGRRIAMALDGLGEGFAADLPDGALRDAVAPAIGPRRLLARMNTGLTLHPFTLRDDAGKTVARGRVELWENRPPKGRPRRHQFWRLVLDPKPRARRALGLAIAGLPASLGQPDTLGTCVADALTAIGDAPDPDIGRLRPGLTPQMTAGEAARAIHRALLDALARNEAGAADGTDSEFLHDFRVAVRRTRAALALVDRGVLPEAMVALARVDFRWLGRQTNRMRDLDVCLLDFPDFEAALPAAQRPFLKPFHNHLRRESQREQRRVGHLLRGKRYRRILDTWQAVLAGDLAEADGLHAAAPVRDFAGPRIWKVYRRLLRQGRAIGDDTPAAALHELRLTAKKLRYLIEFFVELYPADRIARPLKALKALQEVLGRLQDSEVQSADILNFAREMAIEGPVSAETLLAMGMVTESILIRGDSVRQDWQDRFLRVSQPKIRAVFTDLFKPGK